MFLGRCIFTGYPPIKTYHRTTVWHKDIACCYLHLLHRYILFALGMTQLSCIQVSNIHHRYLLLSSFENCRIPSKKCRQSLRSHKASPNKWLTHCKAKIRTMPLCKRSFMRRTRQRGLQSKLRNQSHSGGRARLQIRLYTWTTIHEAHLQIKHFWSRLAFWRATPTNGG